MNRPIQIVGRSLDSTLDLLFMTLSDSKKLAKINKYISEFNKNNYKTLEKKLLKSPVDISFSYKVDKTEHSFEGKIIFNKKFYRIEGIYTYNRI